MVSSVDSFVCKNHFKNSMGYLISGKLSSGNKKPFQMYLMAGFFTKSMSLLQRVINSK